MPTRPRRLGGLAVMVFLIGLLPPATAQRNDGGPAFDEQARRRMESRIAELAARVTELQQASRPSPVIVPVAADGALGTPRGLEITKNEPAEWKWIHTSQEPVQLAAVRQASPAARLFIVVNLQLRGESDAAQAHLAFECLCEGTKHSESITVPVDRSWRRFLVYPRSIPASRLDEGLFRVEPRTRDSLWIDRVEVRTYRVTPDDLRELTKTLSAVSLAWEEKRYADCQRLLDSDWGRFLFEEHVVITQELLPVPSANFEPRLLEP